MRVSPIVSCCLIAALAAAMCGCAPSGETNQQQPSAAGQTRETEAPAGAATAEARQPAEQQGRPTAATPGASSEAPTPESEPARQDKEPSLGDGKTLQRETPLPGTIGAVGHVAEKPKPMEAEGFPTPEMTEQAADRPREESEPGDMAAEKPRDLGPPLADDPKALIPLDTNLPVFIDKQRKQVLIVAEVVQREVPLELFACLKDTKEHEAILRVGETASYPPGQPPRRAMVVHAALLAIGAEPGEPVHFHPTYSPARGQEIEIEVRWKDEAGKVQRARAQQWVRNGKTKKPMEQVWVFAGSGFWTDPTTGERHYQAEAGDLICVANFASATLDVTIQSTSTNDELMFEAFTEHIPPKGTPVTIVLTPQPRKH